MHLCVSGRRGCPGEKMATMELFIYITSLLQRYQILPEEGKMIDMDPIGMTFNDVPQQKLRFVRRK